MTPFGIAVRDGTTLIGDLYLPGPLPAPAILVRTPYDRALFAVEAEPLVDAGYAVVVQSVRGRHGSGGTFRPYFHETDDGCDAIEAIAAQPWCDAQVATMGASYGGWTQWAAARARPPALKTMVSTACCSTWTGEWPWRDGVLFPGALGWLHLVDGSTDQDISDLDIPALATGPTLLPMVEEWRCHSGPDDYWEPITLGPTDFAAIELPVLHVTGWFDGCQLGAHLLYEGMRAHSPRSADQAIVIGPWDHSIRNMRDEYDGVSFGPEAVVDYAQLRIDWFDRWLRGGESHSRARVFITGANTWTTGDVFPDPTATSTTHWLGPLGELVGEPPSTTGSDSWLHDPADPVPARPDGTGAAHPGLRREDVNARADVALWTGEAVAEPVTVTGAAEVRLWLSADAETVDVFAQLSDVAPDGSALLVGHGMRGSVTMTPGHPVEVVVVLTPRAHQLRAGHRWALTAAGSADPLWAHNSRRLTTVTVHRSPAHPSSVTLRTV